MNNSSVLLIALTLWSSQPLLAKESAPRQANTHRINSSVQPDALPQGDAMHHFLIAEMAAERKQPETALEHYMTAALLSQDPEVAKLTTEKAIELHAIQTAFEASALWAKLAQNSLEAQLVAGTLTLGHAPESAKGYFARAIAIEPADIDQHLLSIHQQLTVSDQQQLKNILLELAEKQPKNAVLHLCVAQISAHQMDLKLANTWVESALKLNPKLTHGIQLKAKLIRQKEQHDAPALGYLKQKLSEHPKDEELKLFYATALMDDNQNTSAEKLLKSLTNSDKLGPKVKVLLAEIYIESKQYKKAEAFLQQLTDAEDYRQTALFLLANLAELDSNIEKAIEYYSHVTEGEYHITAYTRAVTLLTMAHAHQKALKLIRSAEPTTLDEQKQLLLTEIDILMELAEFEQALHTASQVLAALPDDMDFLYARGLILASMNKTKKAEADLLKILSVNPQHTNALNALGFTLASQTTRYQEAMQYLSKALELSPNNPLIMDSMGWLLYRMGKLQESRDMLHTAYQLDQDTDIATHLGEVLWAIGEKKGASVIFEQALEATPEHIKLLETIERLKPFQTNTVPAGR